MPAPRILSRLSVNAWLLLIGVPGALLYPHIFPTQQMRNLEAGREHAAVLMKLLQSDSRYSRVLVDVWTSHGGELFVRGELSSVADLEELIRIVKDSHPPVSVGGMLNVGGTDLEVAIPAIEGARGTP